jgi:23S rRNA A2030 N6-methylase RlmJ
MNCHQHYRAGNLTDASGHIVSIMLAGQSKRKSSSFMCLDAGA